MKGRDNDIDRLMEYTVVGVLRTARYCTVNGAVLGT
jgi:hypothetical protein